MVGLSPRHHHLAATDDFSGVAYTQYRLQDGAWLTYTMPFVLAAEGKRPSPIAVLTWKITRKSHIPSPSPWI
ncbi:MAG: hypothetical protein IPH82_28685 [Chloroflexi bacterium]|nr:hypothetical protein [Chloroflexota bacterium]